MLLLLKLIKRAIGTLICLFVEIAIGGILELLSNQSALMLQPDNTLYLFKTIGLWLGKTGLDKKNQHNQYLLKFCALFQILHTLEINVLYLQRMILYLGEKLLPSVYNFLEFLIEHCTNNDCTSSKSNLLQIQKEIYAATLPFLKK
jgi:hypothetical protein